MVRSSEEIIEYFFVRIFPILLNWDKILDLLKSTNFLWLGDTGIPMDSGKITISELYNILIKFVSKLCAWGYSHSAAKSCTDAARYANKVLFLFRQIKCKHFKISSCRYLLRWLRDSSRVR
jgi:hypothetical protein